jgi:hypothetical protein
VIVMTNFQPWPRIMNYIRQARMYGLREVTSYHLYYRMNARHGDTVTEGNGAFCWLHGDERMASSSSYASRISRNLSSALGSLLQSGCHSSA